MTQFEAHYSPGVPPDLGRNPRFTLDTSGWVSHILRSPAEVLTEGRRGPLMVRAVVTLRGRGPYELDGDPQGEHDEQHPATFGLLLFRNWSDRPASRLYGRARTPLREGRCVVECPLRAEHWQTTYAKPYRDQHFRTILRSPLHLGVCFGGKFYGHGVNTTRGAVEVRLDTLAVVPE